MKLEHTNPQLVFLQTPNQHDVYRAALSERLSARVTNFIEDWVDLDDMGNIAILETSSTLNLINFTAKPNYGDATLDCVINLKRINDIRFVNKFLESVNEKLHPGGRLIGCVETSQQREERIMAKYSWPFNRLYFFFDYWVKRVWPKMPYLKQYYFMLTGGRNRVISEMETYGRLYSCGFRLLDVVKAEGKLYFAAEKIGPPEYNIEASYGPLIRLKRIGKNGKPIKVYKFRTMYPYSEYVQHLVYERYGLQSGGKMKNDPRVNAVGHIMRKYWLDELPMLLNLLKGELKIFGVRPISKHYFSLYPEDFQEYRKKFKPGLIPPVYVEIPKDLNEVVEVERRYLQAYERQPLLTDFRYMCRLMYNIIFKKVRSN